MNLQSKLDKIRVILNTYCIRFLSYLGLWFSYYTLIPSLCYPVGSHQQSLAGDEYGDGNLGTRGMALFFHSHKVWVVINAIFGCYSLKGTLAYYFLFYHNFQNLRTVYNYLLTYCLGSITNIADYEMNLYIFFFQCNSICKSLGLTEFDLSDKERKCISNGISDSITR